MRVPRKLKARVVYEQSLYVSGAQEANVALMAMSLC